MVHQGMDVVIQEMDEGHKVIYGAQKRMDVAHQGMNVVLQVMDEAHKDMDVALQGQGIDVAQPGVLCYSPRAWT